MHVILCFFVHIIDKRLDPCIAIFGSGFLDGRGFNLGSMGGRHELGD